MEYLLLILSGVIAVISCNTRYRYISGILFGEFLIMSGYQMFVLSGITGIQFDTFLNAAPFFMFALLMQSAFTITYIYFSGWTLASISASIMIYLSYVVAASLHGIYVINYESVMLSFAIAQLIAGFIGAIREHWNIIDNIRDYFMLSNFKRG